MFLGLNVCLMFTTAAMTELMCMQTSLCTLLLMLQQHSGHKGLAPTVAMSAEPQAYYAEACCENAHLVSCKILSL